jgi:hypothetical protein
MAKNPHPPPVAEPQQPDLFPETMPPRQLDLLPDTHPARERILKAMKDIVRRVLGHSLH